MKRDNSFDVWRGIAIIFVVAIHASNTGKEFLSGPSQWNYFATLGLRQIYNFAVPLFFFMAGFFADKEIETVATRWKTYIGKKLTRILVPYILWSIVIILALQRNFDLLALAKKLLLGQAQGPYYFLIALSFLYILTPVISRFGIKQSTTSCILIINAVAVSIIYFLRVRLGESFTWQMSALPCTSWILFYYLGLQIRKCENQPLFTHFRSIPSAVGLAICCLVLSWIESYFLISHPSGPYLWAGSQIKFSSFLYSIAIINLFTVLRKKEWKYPSFLVFLGQASFGIYLIHELFRGRISYRLSNIENLYAIQPLFQFIVVVATIVCCLIVIEIARRLLGKSNATKYLGF